MLDATTVVREASKIIKPSSDLATHGTPVGHGSRRPSPKIKESKKVLSKNNSRISLVSSSSSKSVSSSKREKKNI